MSNLVFELPIRADTEFAKKLQQAGDYLTKKPESYLQATQGLASIETVTQDHKWQARLLKEIMNFDKTKTEVAYELQQMEKNPFGRLPKVEHNNKSGELSDLLGLCKSFGIPVN